MKTMQITNPTTKIKLMLNKPEVAPIPMKKVDYIDGIPIKWTEQKVHRMNIIENL